MESTGLWLGFASIVLASFITIVVKRRKVTRLPYPPTPKGIPILGNALQVPFHESWMAYQRISKELGERVPPGSPKRLVTQGLDSDIIHLNAAGESIVVLNRVQDAHELLEKRSAKYSSRYVRKSDTRRFPTLIFETSFSVGKPSWQMNCECT